MPKPRFSKAPPAKKSRRESSPQETPSPSPRRSSAETDGRRARGDVTRARVLREATRFASLQGLNGVTVGQVAKASGVSKGHLSILFGNREKLQLATLDAAVEIFREHVTKSAEEAKTPQGKLRRYCLGWFDYVQKKVLPGGCLMTAAASEFRTIDGAVRDKLISLRKRRGDYIRATIAEFLPGPGETNSNEIDDFLYQVSAYEAAANVAWLLEDAAAFAHARLKTVEAIDRVCAKERTVLSGTRGEIG